MKIKTKNKLAEAWQYCEDNNKSTEFMLEYMQDIANVNLACVIDFIQEISNKRLQTLNNNINENKRI